MKLYFDINFRRFRGNWEIGEEVSLLCDFSNLVYRESQEQTAPVESPQVVADDFPNTTL